MEPAEQGIATRGATRQSWQRNKSIRVIIAELQSVHPKASEHVLLQKLRDLAREDDDVLDAFLAYGLRNTLASQEGYKVHERLVASESKEQRSETIAKAAKESATKVLLLNLEMPNGKRLRFCDGNYVAKLGGQFVKAGKKAGHKLIGQVFDENSLRECMGI
jgi:hypothetical protein